MIRQNVKSQNFFLKKCLQISTYTFSDNMCIFRFNSKKYRQILCLQFQDFDILKTDRNFLYFIHLDILKVQKKYFYLSFTKLFVNIPQINFPHDAKKNITQNCLLKKALQIFIHTLREILLIVLTKRSQLFIISKQYQKFCKTYQCPKVYGTKYATSFLL